jgi:hypothetical protein
MEDKKVKVIPIVRKGSWLEQISKSHDGLIMFTGTGATYSVPQTSSGGLVNVLEPADESKIDWLISELGVEKNALSPNRKEKNFWKTEKITRVKITKDGMTLDLNNPYDYIKFLVLKSNKDLIAPSWDARFDKGTYKFAIVDESYEINQGSKKADVLKDCYIQFGKIDDKESKMKGVIKIYLAETKSLVKLPAKTTKEFLKSEINKIIETNPAKFLSIVTDKDFDYKADITEAIDKGYITKIGKAKYQFIDLIDESFTYDELVAYLKNKENSERYIMLKEKIK